MFRCLATLLKRNVETVCNFNIPRWQRCSPYKLLLRLTIDKGVMLGVLVSRWVFLCYQGLGHLAFQVGSRTESCVLRTHASYDVSRFCFRLGQKTLLSKSGICTQFSLTFDWVRIPFWQVTYFPQRDLSPTASLLRLCQSMVFFSFKHTRPVSQMRCRRFCTVFEVSRRATDTVFRKGCHKVANGEPSMPPERTFETYRKRDS